MQPDLGSYMLLTTYRRSGEAVATPVWTVAVSDGRTGMFTARGTGKYQRIRRNPRVMVQACNARGQVKPHSPRFEGSAEIIESGPLFEEVQAKIRGKYSWMIPLVKRISRLQGRLKKNQQFGDTVVLLTLQPSA